MDRDRFDLVIVGAGPAGLAAAVTASRAMRVLVVDEQLQAGGQIFRQPHRAFGRSVSMPRGYQWGHRLLAEAAKADLSWSWGSTVFGILPLDEGFQVAIQDSSGPRTVRARGVLIATGAMDLPVAVPGWTLPGVVMAGAAQTLLKSQGVLIGPRVVLAGAHPLVLLVADQLHRAGAQVAQVAIARGLPGLAESVRALAALPGHMGQLAELSGAIGRLVTGGVSIRTRTILTGVQGTERVTSALLAPVDRNWRPAGPAQRVDTDAVVLGYGFQPTTELARQIGCDLVWDGPAGGWVVRHDAHMRTSVAGVYVAGEPAGVGGAGQSRAEGALAGASVVADLTGRIVRTSPGQIRRARRFAQQVQRMFEPDRQALARLSTPETIVCRCEVVTRSQINDALMTQPHLSSATGVKLMCRAGMGMCQGRYCEGSVAAAVSAARTIPLDEVGRFATHLPVRPVPIDALQALDEQE